MAEKPINSMVQEIGKEGLQRHLDMPARYGYRDGFLRLHGKRFEFNIETDDGRRIRKLVNGDVFELKDETGYAWYRASFQAEDSEDLIVEQGHYCSE